MKKIVFSTIFFVFFITIQPVYASMEWDLDPAHSTISFRITHIFSKVNGLFNDFSTDIAFDEKDLPNSRFNFEIKTKSVNTNISKRDKHLQSADFFNAGKFPSMTFQSTEVKKVENDVIEITGKLTVKGETYNLVLPLKFEGRKDHPAKKGVEVAGFNGEITLDRLAHGVGNGQFYDMGIIGKEVEIFVSLELIKKK